MAVNYPAKDPHRRFTPNGRPAQRPLRTAMRLKRSSDREVGDVYVTFRPLPGASKYMSLHECLESRPPVRIDLEVPTPCTYTVREPYSNTPGGKIDPRPRYSRSLLPYPNTELWTYNACIAGKSPSPWSYSIPSTTGHNSLVKRQAPSYTMATRTIKSLARPNADKEPSPNAYNRTKSSEAVLTHFPSYTIGSRRDKKPPGSLNPGPAHYHPQYSSLYHRSPAFSMRGRTATV